MKIITIALEKGGVLKTTTCVNLAYALANKGYKVGVIDLDIQNHAGLNLDGEGGEKIENLLQRKKQKLSLNDFSTTSNKNLFVIENSGSITSKFFNQFDHTNQPYLLSDLLEGFNELDFIFIDTPPSIELNTVNALISSDFVLAPCTFEVFSITGLKKLINEMEKLKRFNPKLKLLGVVPTKVNQIFSNNDNSLKNIEAITGDKNLIFKSYIRQNVQIAKGQENAQTIYQMNDKKSIEDFNTLCDEFLQKIAL